MGKLDNKVALVTGGNSGIGLATAKRFVAEGAKVYITGRRQKELDAAVKEIGGNVTAVQGDVAKLADLDRLFDTIRKQSGRLDTIFVNAGIAKLAPFGSITEEHYNEIFDINVKGVLFTAQKALPLMGPGSTIVLNASVVASKGYGALSIYSASKAAVRNFARTWATDLKDKKIRVNAVSPGVTITPGFGQMGLTEEQTKGFIDSMVAVTPQGRAGMPDDIAKAVVFLASDDSSYVNGVELFVDGGMIQV
jgi:NAD(P)-dependent dehydrogenase (short-subunit alcohol dehydrogenase family)